LQLSVALDFMEVSFLMRLNKIEGKYVKQIRSNSDFPFALLVEQKVEEYMKYLQNEGVLSGHIRGEYI
jgi:hypothetical protein